MAAAGVGGREGFSSHREGRRPQGLQEAAADQNQRPGALHQVRLVRKQQRGAVTAAVFSDDLVSACWDRIIVLVMCASAISYQNMDLPSM